MKKATLFFLVFIILAFVAGYFLAKQDLFSTVDEPVLQEDDTQTNSVEFYDYSKNKLEELLSVNPENIEVIRGKMTNIVFGTSQLPIQLPDSVFDITDTLYDDISNLKAIEQFKIVQKYNIQSIGYIFKPKEDIRRLFIYHQGHNGDFILGKNIIEYFINKGFTVYAFSMPIFGKNNDPVVSIDKIGTFKLTDDEMGSHELMKFLDNPISFFVAPVVGMINFAQTKNFKDITMCGISGGGWTTTLAAALDTRINYSFPVAGTYPMYIKLNSPEKSYGDFEQVYPPLYRNVSYLDMYVLGAAGNNRFQTQILNLYDPCCFDGTYFQHYESFVKAKVGEFEDGAFEVILDTENPEHKISEFSIAKIYNKIKSIN